MTPNEALEKVLDIYEVKPQRLAEDSGVNKSIISKFLNGKEMHTGNLQKIVQALPPDAKAHFTVLFASKTTKVAEESNSSKV